MKEIDDIFKKIESEFDKQIEKKRRQNEILKWASAIAIIFFFTFVVPSLCR